MEHKMSDNKKELVIFDIDKTLIEGQSQRLLINYLYKQNYIGVFFYAKIILWFALYKIGLFKNPRKIMDYSYTFAKGKSVNYIHELLEDFYESVLKECFYQEAVSILEKHSQEKRQILIISNVVSPLARIISDRLSINNYIATKLEKRGNKYTGNIKGEIIYGEEKMKKAKQFMKDQGFSPSNTWAYADHHSDISLLKNTSKPHAVNPTKRLFKEAKRNDWQILSFVETTSRM